MSRPPTPKLRLFLAVRPEPTVLETLGQVLASTRAALPSDRLRWTATDKLHLTLRFFGGAASDTPVRIGSVCRAACASMPPFTLALRGAGAFPSARRGSVLWIGVADGATELRTLAGRLNPPLDALGFEREEREFKPHLTVARAKQPLPLAAAIAALSNVSIPTRISELLLVRSVLGGPTPRYEVLERYALG